MKYAQKSNSVIQNHMLVCNQTKCRKRHVMNSPVIGDKILRQKGKAAKRQQNNRGDQVSIIS